MLCWKSKNEFSNWIVIITGQRERWGWERERRSVKWRSNTHFHILWKNTHFQMALWPERDAFPSLASLCKLGSKMIIIWKCTMLKHMNWIVVLWRIVICTEYKTKDQWCLQHPIRSIYKYTYIFGSFRQLTYIIHNLDYFLQNVIWFAFQNTYTVCYTAHYKL